MKKLLMAVALAVIAVTLGLGVGTGGGERAHAFHIPYATGDVFAGVGAGQINHYDPTGALLEVLDTTSGSAEQTGMCFDAAGNLYATSFTANNMTKFDNQGGLLVHPWGGPFSTHPESCVVDAAGNIYTGEVDGANQIRKFDAAGTPLATYSPAVENRGLDWIDLAADQCTMYYTSEGSSVKSFDVCTSTQLADFASGLSGPCFALRIRANSEVMVTCSTQTYRLNPDGTVNMTYPIGGEFLFAMNLDPDGLHFWTGGFSTGNIYKVDIATGAGTGAPLFTAPPAVFSMAGLAIFGEPTQGGGGCAESPIAPSSVEEIIFPGASAEIEKCVETPEIPPKPDIYFLADTTGSMGPAIVGVQGSAAAVLAAIDAATTDPRYGAGDYKDFPFDAYAFNNAAPIPAVDDDGAAALAAIAGWSAAGGADGSEGQFFAMDQIASSAAAFRPDSVPIVVWFGDAPAHDPVCSAISGLGYDIDEASLTAKLIPAGIKVVAISTVTGFPAGLDDDPTTSAGDYAPFCAINGAPGQATRIAAATGGVHLSGVGPGDIADAILAGLAALQVEVAMVSDCTDPISVTFDPPSQTVVSGSNATFTETISVAADAPGGTYECDDWVTIDGEPLVDPATGELFVEHKVIKVPEGFLTGGGQIDNGRGKNKAEWLNASGNVGFLADFSLVGQWNVVFHDVTNATMDLDKAHFHSTAITALQFFHDGGAGPNPPPANANVAQFSATGRLGQDPGWTLDVCLADRGEPGRKNDSIRLRLFDPGGGLVYDSLSDFASEDDTLSGVCEDRHKLDTGNYQIHSGVKDS